MNIKEALYGIICNFPKQVTCTENSVNFIMQLTSNEYHIISIEYIENLHLLRDYNIDISVIGSSGVIISCNLCNIESIEEFNNEISEYIQDEFGDLNFEIYIKKRNHPGFVQVISYTDYICFLSSLSISELIEELHKLSGPNSQIWFYTPFDEINIFSSSFTFSKNNPPDQNIMSFRNNIIEKAKFDLNNHGAKIYSFLPEDFIILPTTNDFESKKLFDKLQAVYYFIFLSNYSELHNDTLLFQIRGERTINIEIDFNLIDPINGTTLNDYRKIFDWIYKDSLENGHFYDKKMIAQNILSIYLSNQNVLSQNLHLFSAILSAFKVYIRHDVETYIETKGSVLNLLNEFNNSLFTISENFANRIKNNLIAFITFLFSTFLMNTISNGKIENIFTRDVTLISYGFIVVSFFYFLITLWNFRKDIIRYKQYYFFQKEYYNNILNSDDIDEVFKHDGIYKESMNDIKRSGILYSMLWLLFLTVAIYCLYQLSGYSMIDIIL